MNFQLELLVSQQHVLTQDQPY